MQMRHQYEMKVRDYECDAQGVVNNANYLHYFEAARHEMMEAGGVTLTELTARNILPVVRNANIAYKNSLRGSDVFVCLSTVERKPLRLIFHQELRRKTDNVLCAKASFELVCVVNGKVTAAMDVVERAFAPYIVTKQKDE